jgi:glucose-1-phosphate thymidylyltransferase
MSHWTGKIANHRQLGGIETSVLDNGAGRGVRIAWIDTGTFESLNQAGQYVETIQERQGLMVGCIEEIAYNNEWINIGQLDNLADKFSKNSYGKYLKKLSTIIE